MNTDLSSVPDQLIDPRDKDEKWCKLNLEYIYSSYNTATGSNYPLYQLKLRMIENKAYSQGMQSTGKYKKLMGCDDTGESYLNIMWEVPKIWSKYRDLAHSLLEKFGYKVSCNALNGEAYDEKLDTRYKMEMKLKMIEDLKAINEAAGGNVSEIPEEMPESMEELEIYLEMNLKHAVEIAAEQGIDLTLYINDWKEISSRIRYDLIDYDLCWTKTYVDYKGALRVRHVEPLNMIWGFTNNRDFKNAPYYAELLTVTIAQLKEMDVKNELTHDMLIEIAKKYAGTLGNAFWSSINTNFIPGYGYEWYHFKVNVLDGEWESVNKTVYKKRKDRHGNTTIRQEDFSSRNKKNTETKEYIQDDERVFYQGKLIVNSPYVFDYGLCEFMNKPQSQLGDVQSSYTGFSVNWTFANTSSMTDRVRPFVDGFCLAWYKYQNEIANSRPKGIAVDAAALSEITYGKGGEALSPQENIKNFNQTGNIIINTIDEDGNPISFPITELQNGTGIAAQQQQAAMLFNIDQIRQLTGINESIDGSTPNAEQSATASNLLAASANNSIYPIANAYSNVLLRTAKSVLTRLQQISKHKDITGYISSIGDNAMKTISVTSDISLNDLGIVLEPDMSERERMVLEQEIQVALNQRREAGGVGGIELEDAVAIRSARNLKLAMRILAIKRKKREQMDEKKKQQAIAFQTQQQIQSNESATKAKMEQDQMALKIKDAMADKQMHRDMAINKQLHDYKMDEIRMTGNKKIQDTIIDNHMNNAADVEDDKPLSVQNK